MDGVETINISVHHKINVNIIFSGQWFPQMWLRHFF